MNQNGVLQKDDNDYPVMGGTSSVDDNTIINSAFDPITRRLLVDDGGSGGGGVNIEVPTGTVDGSNLVFSFVHEPKAISIDGLVRRATKGYTISGAGPYTVTVDALTPPFYDVFSIY